MTDLAPLALGTIRLTPALVVVVLGLAFTLAALMAWWLYVTARIWRDRAPATPAGLATWDVSPDGTITQTGGAIEESGYRSGELAGTSIWPWAPPGSDAETAYRGALQGGVASTFDNTFESRDGRRLVWRIVVAPLPNGSCRAKGIPVTDLVLRAEAADARADAAEARADDAADDAAAARRAERGFRASIGDHVLTQFAPVRL